MALSTYKNLHLLLLFSKRKRLLNLAIEAIIKQEVRNKALVPYKKPPTDIVPINK